MSGSKNGSKAPAKLAPREQAILDALCVNGNVRVPVSDGMPIENLYNAYMNGVPKKVKREKNHRRQQQVVGSVIFRIHRKRPAVRIVPYGAGLYKLTRNRQSPA